MLNVSIAKKLRILRVSKNLTQTDLGKLAGCSQNTVSNLETGFYQPTLRLAYRISRALDCRIDDLVEVFEDERNQESCI